MKTAIAKNGRTVAAGIIAWSALLALCGAPAAATGDPYPLGHCIVSGEKLGSMGNPVSHEYKGRNILFCCAGCVKSFDKEPEKFLKRMDEEIIKTQTPLYPLDTCVVSAEKLGGEMGAPVDYVYNNRLVCFCCKACIKTFEKDPAKHLKKLDDAVVAGQKPSYPLTTCPVTGRKLGAGAIDHVSGNRLIRFCSPSCASAFEKNPPKYWAQVDAAVKTAVVSPR